MGIMALWVVDARTVVGGMHRKDNELG